MEKWEKSQTKPANMLNWHFWNKKHRIQVVVEAKNYPQANKRLKDAIPDMNFIFQFGEK